MFAFLVLMVTGYVGVGLMALGAYRYYRTLNREVRVDIPVPVAPAHTLNVLRRDVTL